MENQTILKSSPLLNGQKIRSCKNRKIKYTILQNDKNVATSTKIFDENVEKNGQKCRISTKKR